MFDMQISHIIIKMLSFDVVTENEVTSYDFQP